MEYFKTICPKCGNVREMPVDNAVEMKCLRCSYFPLQILELPKPDTKKSDIPAGNESLPFGSSDIVMDGLYIKTPSSDKDRLKELRKKLADIEYKNGRDWESAHSEQDEALLDFIGDDEVLEIFGRTTKWYA